MERGGWGGGKTKKINFSKSGGEKAAVLQPALSGGFMDWGKDWGRNEKGVIELSRIRTKARGIPTKSLKGKDNESQNLVRAVGECSKKIGG